MNRSPSHRREGPDTVANNTGVILLTVILAGTIVIRIISNSLSPYIEVTVPPAPVSYAVNINTACREELACLPGIGPVKAGRIIKYRKAHGPFRSKKELENIEGFGPGTVKRISSLIRIEQ